MTNHVTETSSHLRLTPLHGEHIAVGARMVEYAGWSMPVLYTSILEEARAVRSGVGIFDISHMGRVRMDGSRATELLQCITSNNVEALSPSHAQYSLLTNSDGGIIDDIIVYREAHNSYIIVINASNTEKDLSWVRHNMTSGVDLVDNTAATAMIAVQGPDAPATVAQLAEDAGLLSLKRFQYAQGKVAGKQAIFCRTGYTGEDGFELIVASEDAARVWRCLLEAGSIPCGLGARDALRIEAGYPLYGHEIDDTTSPVDAALMWVVSLDKGDFVGKEAIRVVKQNGALRKLVGLKSDDRQQPRQGYTIHVGEETVGTVTSGVFSPTLNRSIAMGYVSTAHARPGTPVTIAVRGKRITATVCAKKSLLE